MTQGGPLIAEVVHRSLTQTIYDVRWVPGTAKFVALGCHPRGTGALQLWELDGSELTQAAAEEPAAALKCACFFGGSGGGSTQQLLALGSFSGQLQLVDVERLGSSSGSSSSSTVFCVQAHAGIVNGVDALSGSEAGPPLIATCGNDGGVRVWDARDPAAPAAAFLPGPGAPARGAWCVALGNAHAADQACVLAGYDNGDLRMFDLRGGGGAAERWSTSLGKGVCGVQFDRRDIQMNKFIATCLESRLAMFDARTQHPADGFAGSCEPLAGRDATLWGVHHLPQNRDVFMVTGGDGQLALFRYRYPDQRVVESKEGGVKRGVVGTAELLADRGISCQPVAGFDWSPDKPGAFVAAAFDQTLRVGLVSRVGAL